ncbi:hypothetical protein [Salinibacterium sp. ZJ450]|uniref:hypothetical protein n=1 Tax=Salinibacterium sp. ZJ450 TaxID=2708338 RepID=UPI001423E678|nr:hypothetical protein [Salinibacterium sp. ZJ450]
MNRRQVTITVIAVLVALGLIVVGAVALTGRQPTDSALIASPSPTPTATSGTEARSDAPPTATPGPDDGEEPGGTNADGAPGSGSDGAPGSAPGSGAPGTTPADPTPPVGPAPAPLFVAPLPATASAEGELTTGFPSQVVPLAPDSRVVSSSLASEGTRLQVGLTATSGTAAAAVLDHYQSVYGPLGFASRPADAVSGTTAWVFTRGENAVTVSVYQLDTGSAYTVFGTFTAG